MQGARAFDRKRFIIFIIVPIILFAALVTLDQTTKYFAERDKVRTTVIPDFFYLSYSVNKGAGFSFLADKEWGQLLFKIITPVALVAFIVLYVFAAKKSYKWLAYSVLFIISGTIGNYIDRLLNGQVVDFLSFQFGSYFFPTFNVADVCLTVGVIMLIVHFLFFDTNAVLKKQDKTEGGEISAEDADAKQDENL